MNKIISIMKDDDGRTLFTMEITTDLDYMIGFTVYKVTSWEMNGDICDTEQYLKGTIKWDGCSHWWFGEEEDGKSDGYLHLCGYEHIKRHCELVDTIFKYCAENMKNFDKEVADYNE